MSSFQGQLLIATPQLADPNFSKTVLFIVQHDEDGALGLVLNRPTNVPVKSAWEQVGQTPSLCEGYLRIGGPCQGPWMLLHADAGAGEREVLPGVFFSVEDENVTWLMQHPSDPVRCFIGYAGWTAGQLENEIESGSWELQPVGSQDLLEADEDFWHKASASARRKIAFPNLLPHMIPTDPSMN